MKDKVDLVPFQSWHLKLFKEGHEYQAALLDPDIRVNLYRHTNGITLLLDGKIAAILGIVILWNGVAEVTMIPSDLFYQNLRPCVKVSRTLLAILAETFTLHRLQALTLVAAPKHQRFAEFMGFVKEGHLHNYGPSGEDFILNYLPLEV